ncbi:MAG: hypothetical protein ABWU16_08150, partial [Halothiobacillaceae bacterium]
SQPRQGHRPLVYGTPRFLEVNRLEHRSLPLWQLLDQGVHVRARFSVRVCRALGYLPAQLLVERFALALLLWAFIGTVAGIRHLQHGGALLPVDGRERHARVAL